MFFQKREISKENDLFAVYYDKGNELCIMKSQTYDKKLQKTTLNCTQFTEIKGGTQSLILKMEKDIINTLLERSKEELISYKT